MLSSHAPLATYTYDGAGRRIGRALENGTVSTYAYDDADRLLSLGRRLGSTAFATFAYTYNTVSNRTSMASTQAPGLPGAQTDGYGYDAVDQITAVAHGANRTASFSYDAVGNRQATADTLLGAASYSANNLNQYTSITGASGASFPAHDANGNLSTEGDWTYGYDAQNCLKSAAGATERLDTVYDARNRPVLRTPFAVAGGIFSP